MPVNRKKSSWCVRWKQSPMLAAHWWSLSRQITSLMYFGNRSSLSRVVAEHSVHKRCKLVPFVIVPRFWHPRKNVPGDVRRLLFRRCCFFKSSSSLSAWRIGAWCFVLSVKFITSVFFGSWSGVFGCPSGKVVRSSKPLASVMLTAAYRLFNPPVDPNCTKRSCSDFLKHTTGPGSSSTRLTLEWFRQMSGFALIVANFVILDLHGYLNLCLILFPGLPR